MCKYKKNGLVITETATTEKVYSALRGEYFTTLFGINPTEYETESILDAINKLKDTDYLLSTIAEIQQKIRRRKSKYRISFGE